MCRYLTDLWHTALARKVKWCKHGVNVACSSPFLNSWMTPQEQFFPLLFFNIGVHGYHICPLGGILFIHKTAYLENVTRA